MMPLTGWLAGRFGIKYMFLASVVGFTVASALCGAATSLRELVLFRALQGLAGAGLIPLSQATLLQINPPERHGHAMAVFGIGTILGPIMGPALGGWLTQDYSWRWIFYINLPVGVLCTLGILIFIRQTRNVHREPFDFIGFLTLSLGIGALQLMLDRGELKDWFHSSEIWIEATVAGLGFYLFTVHTATTDERSFLNRDLLKSANFVAGTLLMFSVGLIMTGTSALLPTMLQNLMNYPALTTGLVTVPRGFGSMAAMFFVARVINRVDNRMIILFGFVLTASSMWQMTQFSLQMGMAPVIISGVLQGFGLGCTFVPLNIIALSNLPRHILTQGTAIRSLMRNLGGSIGISVLVATLAQNTQVVHSRLVEGLRPDNPLAQAPYLSGAVQPEHAERDRGTQRRGDAAGRHGRLHRRFQADDVDRARVGAAATAVARGAPPPAARGGRYHRGRRRLAALKVGGRGEPARTWRLPRSKIVQDAHRDVVSRPGSLPVRPFGPPLGLLRGRYDPF